MQYHLKFPIPPQRPFDRDDWHIQAYGEVLLPLSEKKLNRFWFSRYQESDGSKYVLFRYEADEKIADSPLAPSEHKEFDIAADLSGNRFFGTNRRFSDAKQRGDKTFDFLHQSAQLTLAQLSHKDTDGYWILEESSDRGNNHFGSPLESIHHLFCNSSAAPVSIALVHIPKKDNQPPMIWPCGMIQAKNSGLFASDTQVVRIEH